MKSTKSRRTNVRPRQSSVSPKSVARKAPVLQELEPRKLLYIGTLYANEDAGMGHFSSITALIAMPVWVLPGTTVDSELASERMVRVRFSIFDANPFSTASVTLLDLRGQPIYPWAPPDGETEFTFATATGVFGGDDDGYWGTEDDDTIDAFALDGGYNPGYRWLAGPDEILGNADDVLTFDSTFHPVDQLTLDNEFLNTQFGTTLEQWTVETDAGTLAWSTAGTAGNEAENYTGLTSNCASVSSAAGNQATFDTSVISPTMDLTDQGELLTLSFAVNYQKGSGGNDHLEAYISTDGGTIWTQIDDFEDRSYGESRETPGEAVTLNIKPFVPDGGPTDNVKIRFRYYSSAPGVAEYAQVDGVRVRSFASNTGGSPVVIPATGYWYVGPDGFWETEDDTRLPYDFKFLAEPIDNGTDDRLLFTLDDPSILYTLLPAAAADGSHLVHHLVDRRIPGRIANDGIADFNNGIGQIIFANTSLTTRFTMVVVDEDGVPLHPFETIIDMDEFALAIDPFTLEPVLPAAFGNVIVGNHTNADWTADGGILNPNFLPDDWQNFKFESDPAFPNRNPEGLLWVADTPEGEPTGPFAWENINDVMGRIAIDGALFGVSHFTGAIDILHVGYFGGGVIVDGEMDGFIVGGTAAFIDYPVAPPGNTGAFLQVGRNLGSFIVGGRAAARVNVQGDYTAAATTDRPFVRSSNVVLEYENTIHLGDDDDLAVQFSLANVAFILPPGEEEEDTLAEYMINDTFGGAQYIGRVTSHITVSGTINGGETAQNALRTEDEDEIDQYVFAVDGQREIRINLFFAGTTIDIPVLITAQDEFGNILASRGITGLSGQIRFTPNSSGVIYIVIDSTATPQGPDTGYDLVVNGIAATSLGEVRAVRSMRYLVAGGAAIRTEVGSIGSIRVGLDAGEDTTDAFINNVLIDSSGDIWNVTAGNLLGGALDDDGNLAAGAIGITADGNIGSIFAGLARATGDDATPLGGSVIGGLISAGGNIGKIWAVGVDTSFGDIGGASDDGNQTRVSSGLLIVAGGSIGLLHADNRIYGTLPLGTEIIIGNDGVIDMIEAGAIAAGNIDLTLDKFTAGILTSRLQISTTSGGAGNVRFVRAPHIFAVGENGDSLTITGDQSLTLVDDSGAVFTIRMVGGAAGSTIQSFAEIITQPITGSRGSAIARITALLAPGADLVITNNTGHVEIGDIIVFGSSGVSGRGSNITFLGSGRTDVALIRAFGAFDTIKNSTTGDIIALDVESVENVLISGNLGRTRTVQYGPRLLGPELGTGLGEGGGVGGAMLASDVGLGTEDFNLGGGPFDAFLNGMVARGGVVQKVQVGGAIGDAIFASSVERIEADSDGFTPQGEFHGIVGTVYSAVNIEFIDVGDGLIAPGFGPNLIAGISATGQVERVVVDGPGRNIAGLINGVGAQILSLPLQDARFGIGRIEGSNGGGLFGAWLTTVSHGDHWVHPDGAIDTGRSDPLQDIGSIRISGGGHMTDTLIETLSLDKIDIKGGQWDNNDIIAFNDIDSIRADRFINSDLEGTSLLLNLITAAGNVGRIETNGRAGDIESLNVDIQGDLDKFGAFNILGVDVDVDQVLGRVDAKSNLYRSFFTTGTVTQVNVDGDIARLTLDTAGPIKKLQSKRGAITRLDLLIEGPDGRLDTMQAIGDITGDFAVSGPIKKIYSKSGDVVASIRTFSGDGEIGEIRAGRDLLITLDSDGNVGKLTAGRNLGNGGEIRVRGDLGDATTGATATADAVFFIEGALTGTFRAGTLASGSTIDAMNGIDTIDVGGGLDGRVTSHANGIARADFDGGLTAGSSVNAFDGGISSLTFSGGDVDGDIFSEEDLGSLTIRGGDFNGTVRGMTNIVRMTVDGDVTGGQVIALYALSFIDVNGSVTSGTFGAGRTIQNLSIDGSVAGSFILAGLEDLGADGALGGILLNSDTFSSGTIQQLTIGGGIDSSVIAAGVSGGSDGSYATLDAATDLAAGLSHISRVTIAGAATGGNLIVADTTIGLITIAGTVRTIQDPGAGVTLTELDAADPTLPGGTNFSNGVTQTITESDGDIVTLTLRGAGTGTYTVNGAGNLNGLIFVGTGSSTFVDAVVTGGGGNGRVDFANVAIRAADDSSFAGLNLGGNIDGTDSLSVDGTVGDFAARLVSTSGSIVIGDAVSRFTVDSVSAGSIAVVSVGAFQTTAGGFAGSWVSEIIGSFTVNGNVGDASIYGRDSIGSIRVTGALGSDPAGLEVDPAFVATDGSLGSLSAASASRAIISAGNSIGSITISGSVTFSDILAGHVLGSDGTYGGVGTAADRVTDGVLDRLTVQGDFDRSNISAGVDRGTDGYYGTADDIGDLGFGIINSVTVSGQILGSNFNSETFAITATGEVGQVRASGQDFNQSGNVRLDLLGVTPVPIRVESISSRLEANTFFIDIVFSEDLDASTILVNPTDPFDQTAISVTSATGGVDPSLVAGDYFILYNETARTAVLQFNPVFTRENPDIYTVTIDGQILRSSGGILLDGNGDGTPGDDFASRSVLGDGGDRTVFGDTWDHDNNATTDPVVLRDPTNIDLVFEDLVNGTGRKNREITFDGQIGDHPQQDPLFFPQRMDVDIFSVTLEAGDVFRTAFNSVAGSGFFGQMTLRVDAGGQILTVASEGTLGLGYVVQSTGVYYLVVTGATLVPLSPFASLQDLNIDLANATGVFNLDGDPIDPDSVANDVGRFEIRALIFDDDDTGFDRGFDADLTDGVPKVIDGLIGRETNGAPVNPFVDFDVIDLNFITEGGSDVLPEGATVTISVILEQFGANLGGTAEIGLFQTTNTTGVNDGMLMGAPSFLYGLNGAERRQGNAQDLTFTMPIPEDGRYALAIQGNLETNYRIIVTVDTGAAGPRTLLHQNVLLEINGGSAEWLNRFGTTLAPFSLKDLGFEGFENEVLSTIISDVENDYADAGVDVRVSLNPADFAGEEFSTIFLANNFGEETFFGGLLGIAQSLDPLNANRAEEAVVFLSSFEGIFRPGQHEDLAHFMADVVNHELGHTLGLRHTVPGFMEPPGIMAGGSQFKDDADDLGDVWFLGMMNEVQLLQLTLAAV